MMNRSIISIAEYDELCKDSIPGCEIVSAHVFDELLDFVGHTNNSSSDIEDRPPDVLRLSSKFGKPTLKAQNYVGVINARGTTIEILPKIADDIGSYEEVRAIFIQMLSQLHGAPFKHLGRAALDTTHTPIMELFIAEFLEETWRVIKRGICSDYVEWEENERFLKGRLVFNEHVKLNHSDKSRFAVRYSIYHVNRPENRLVKSTLKLLAAKTRHPENRKRVRALLEHFGEVPLSGNYALDFAACKNDRNVSHYSTVLSWCRIFLSGESFSPFAGIMTADALLFPMERVFQDYVAAQLKNSCQTNRIAVSSQDCQKHLFDEPKEYQLRPDIVASKQDRRIILDTKWKLHDKPTQADMYQMFAYAMKYSNADDVILVYPSKTYGKSSKGSTIFRSMVGDREIRVHTFSYGLSHPSSPQRVNHEQQADCILADILESLFTNKLN